jgi:geranyl-CoA carboxylase alpha subunit
VKRLLIANRGEIALRVARTARELGIATIAVYSDADVDAPHVRAMDAAVRLGPAPPADSYLSIGALLAAARAAEADAIHPGYGFLAESPEFAERCVEAGLIFVGPSGAAMRALGDKAAAKRLLADSDVPFVPGYHGNVQSDAALLAAARAIGMPVMIKAAAGGGGRGMRLVTAEDRFLAALASARSEARAAFGSDDVLLERALIGPRHVEVQVFADSFGNVVHLGERDCSVQRRHQKLIEEAPSPAVDTALREELGAAAIAVIRAAAYVGAATVEFLLDADGDFFFIEVNARLQVEHPVTEAVTGVDLVEWQLRVARGEPLPLAQSGIHIVGHAIEARLCAEDPARDFLPQTGTLVAWQPPRGVRTEHALERGITISPYYDSMIAKFIASGKTREDARRRLIAALGECVVLGLPTNRGALIAYLEDRVFAAGAATTRFIDERTGHSAAAAGAPAIPLVAQPPPPVVALAAALHYCLAAERGRFGPWTAWSSSQLPPSTISLSFGDAPARLLTVVAESALRVRVADRDGDTPGDDGMSVVEFCGVDDQDQTRYAIDGEPWRRLVYAVSGTTAYLDFDGATYAATDRSAEPAARLTPAAGDGFLRAPMSGRIVRFGGRSGERLAAGAPLVVIEAMKMEQTLTLPIDVVLRDVSAIVGSQVSANEILLAYEPAIAPAPQAATTVAASG